MLCLERRQEQQPTTTRLSLTQSSQIQSIRNSLNGSLMDSRCFFCVRIVYWQSQPCDMKVWGSIEGGKEQQCNIINQAECILLGYQDTSSTSSHCNAIIYYQTLHHKKKSKAILVEHRRMIIPWSQYRRVLLYAFVTFNNIAIFMTFCCRRNIGNKMFLVFNLTISCSRNRKCSQNKIVTVFLDIGTWTRWKEVFFNDGWLE